MSYVDSIDEEPPNAWSTCSNEDFENWYNQEGWRCLKRGNVSTRVFQMWHFLGQGSMTIGHISSQFFAITFVFSIVIFFFNLQHQDHPTEPPATPYLDPTYILTADSLLYTMGSHILAAPQLMGMPSLGVWPMMLGDIVMRPAQKVWNLSVYFSGYP